MTAFVKDPLKEKTVEDALRFPDRAAFDTKAEYDATVRQYWKTMGKYRDLASEFHKQLLKGTDTREGQDKEKHDPKRGI